MEHFFLLATLCHSCVYSSKCSGVCGVCLREGGTPVFIQGKIRSLKAILGAYLAPAILACFYVAATATRGREAPRGERLPPRSGWPLTIASGHRLCVVGYGLDQDGLPVVLCPICIDVIGVSLVSLCKLASRSTFQWFFSTFYVCDLQNMPAWKLVEGC
jgi:hypothetical protein